MTCVCGDPNCIIPYGTCHCGCGELTRIAKNNSDIYRSRRGQPQKFVLGHPGRMQALSPHQFIVEDRGYRTPCWIWQRATSGKGYGHLRSEGRQWLAHRLFYVRKYGPVPEGKMLDHLCRQRPCCNPDHLEPVDDVTNSRRGLLAKLTEAQAESIRSRKHESVKKLAAEFQVAPPTIRDILIGKTWSPRKEN